MDPELEAALVAEATRLRQEHQQLVMARMEELKQFPVNNAQAVLEQYATELRAQRQQALKAMAGALAEQSGVPLTQELMTSVNDRSLASPQALYDKGGAAYQAGNFTDAQRFFSEANTVQPSDAAFTMANRAGTAAEPERRERRKRGEQ